MCVAYDVAFWAPHGNNDVAAVLVRTQALKYRTGERTEISSKRQDSAKGLNLL